MFRRLTLKAGQGKEKESLPKFGTEHPSRFVQCVPSLQNDDECTGPEEARCGIFYILVGLSLANLVYTAIKKGT